MPTINQRFRDAREHLKMSQDEFAKKANRTRSEIKNIEYNKTTPKDEVISAICSAHGISRKWIETGEGEMQTPVSRDTAIGDFMGEVMNGEDADFRRRLVAVLSKLDTAEWELLEKMALKLAEENKKEGQA